ncbi:MAG: MBL fold metallo-hydrolase [Bacilli bacterium]|nr:MBL fold metallo-hydrolase [Bacilli bacterium]
MRSDKLKLQCYKSKFLGANLYLLENCEGQIVIDPCVDYEVVFKDRNANLQAIIITHCHFDHLFKLSSYLENSLCPVYLHQKGIEKLDNPDKNGSRLINSELRFYLPVERIFEINSDLEVSLLGKEFHFLETPGHSSCSLSILVEDLLFTGDTLFKGSIGRCDLESSNSKEMKASLNKLMALDGNLQVFPGHLEMTTLEYEKSNNPFLKGRNYV